MAWGENYGSACVIDQRAGVDATGAIVAWDCEPWAVSLGGRPGYDHPGNVITGALAGYEPQTITPRSASEPTGELRNGNNAVPSYVVGCISGKCGGAGSIRGERVLSHTVKSPLFTGPLRSPLRLQNTFAHESFMDEVSAHVLTAPYQAFRTRDGWINSGGANQANWERIADVLGHPEWRDDPRFVTNSARMQKPIRSHTACGISASHGSSMW